MKVVNMCRPEFDNAGLEERPPIKNGKWGRGGWGCFQIGSTLKNDGGGTKNNKEIYIFKRGSFGAAQVGKVEQRKQTYIFEKGGPSEQSRSKKWSV